MKNLLLVLLFLPVIGFSQCTNGNQVTYGNDSWRGYVYNLSATTSFPPANPFVSANYKGFVTEPAIFDRNIGAGSVTGNTTSLCSTYSDKFSVKYKMTKTFTAGYYTFTVGGDDGYRLSIDGGATYIADQFTDHIYMTTTTTSYYLSGSVDLVLDYYENGSNSEVSFSYTACPVLAAPTSISGGDSAICAGSSVTLTALGTTPSGSTFQWGTGSVVGDNVIAGQTGASITVSPTANTTYWVRRYNTATCASYSAGTLKTVAIVTAPGTPSVFGDNSWIAYVYSGADISLSSAVYKGYYTQSTLGFTTQNTAVNGWSKTLSPSSSADWHGGGCTIGVDDFTVVQKRKGFPCGTYTVKVTDWDDAAEIYIDGTLKWSCTGYSGGNASACNNGTVGTFTLGPDSTIEVRLRENGGDANLALAITKTSTDPTAPTSITQSATATCGGSPITLTAVGGALGTNGVYEWGTGNVGDNIISGATGITYTSSPTVTATYWVRVKNNFCGTYTAGASKQVTIAIPASPATDFGVSSWNVYGYSGTDTSIASAYKGYYTQNLSTTDLGFSTISGTNSWDKTLSPSSAAGWVGCPIPNDNFVMVFKRKGFPCGTYNITLTDWDDSAQVYVDGEVIFSCNGWSGELPTYPGDCVAKTISFDLGTASTIEVRVQEGVGNSLARMTILRTSADPVAGTLNTAKTTVCKNTMAADIVLSGNVGNVLKWQSATNSAFTTGVTDIASMSTTLTSNEIGALSSTLYFRALVQSSMCTPIYTTPIVITVPAAVTYNGTAWSGTPNENTAVSISGSLVVNSDLKVCSCEITNNSTVTINSNKTLYVTGNVKVDNGSSLIVEDDANLVQINDNAVNTGIIKVKRETTPLVLYDYTYWSAPVSGATLSTLSANLGSSIFYRFDAASNNWAGQSDTQIMQVGQGYISRAPSNMNFNANPKLLVTFSGLQNSGVINTPVVKNASNNFNLIGNPYPSALDAKKFIIANQTKIGGTIYFWTHKTAKAYNNPNGGSGTYNYSADDYAKYNLTGGVSTGIPSEGTNHSDSPIGKIASGQAFFVEALVSGTANVNYNNAMRLGGADSNTQFFRTAAPAEELTEEATQEPTGNASEGRVWLNMTNTQGAYSEILLGYVNGATNSYDNLYDGRTMDGGNFIGLYSILDQDNLAIQGKAVPFADSDVVPLGFTTTIAESFTIAINDFDGFFNSQNVYLVDKLLNVTTNLKQASYDFSTEIGVFNNRFELRFADPNLGIEVPVLDKNDIGIIRSGNQIQVNSNKESIATVMVYDLLGKVIYQKAAINSTTFSTNDLNVHNQVVIVKVQTDNKLEMVKKVIMN